jgi:hypothetical protein
MRVRPVVLAACALACLAGRATADVIQPPVTDAYGWADGEARTFSLTWNGQTSTFSVDKVGSATYHTLEQCCTDMVNRITEINPGSSLLFSGLVLNSRPIGLSFLDGINFDLLRAESPSFSSLDGYVTLELSPASRVSKPVFDFSPLVGVSMEGEGSSPGSEGSVPAVPEPASLVLMGTGLIAVGKLMHRRKPQA